MWPWVSRHEWGGNHRVRQAHLERLVTGSRITMHSFTSPYLQKYSFRPSEAEEQQVQSPPQHQPHSTTEIKGTFWRIRNFHLWQGIKQNREEILVPSHAGSVCDTSGVRNRDLPCVVCQLSPPMNILLQKKKGENRMVRFRNSGLRNEQWFLERAQRCGVGEREVREYVSVWKLKFSTVTRGRGGSPRRTGCSGSLPSPFSVLAAWMREVRVRAELSGAECGRTGAEWAELGGFGPGWHGGERARFSRGQTPPPPQSPVLHPTGTRRWSQAAGTTADRFRFGLST